MGKRKGGKVMGVWRRGRKADAAAERPGLCAAAVAAVLCAALLCACGEKEEEIPMGRYADRDVKLPTGSFTYMHPCDDGSYYLYGTEADLTYVDAQGQSKEPGLGEYSQYPCEV